MKVANVLLQHVNSSGDLLERLVIKLLDCVQDDEALAEPIFDFARRCCRLMLKKKRLDKAAVYALRLQDLDLLVESILHAQTAGDENLVRQLTTVLDCVRDSYSSSFSSSSSSSRSSSYSSSVTSSSPSCSTCNESHTVENIQPQLSNLHLGNWPIYIIKKLALQHNRIKEDNEVSIGFQVLKVSQFIVFLVHFFK